MIQDTIVAIIILAVVLFLAYFFLPKHGVVAYNCSIAEISPDYPPEIKNECRKLNVERYKK
jgi:hypothetical protein